MRRFDKLDVAVEFLDAAVSEHLDHARHFAAYNLAAVAEELVSKLLKSACKRDVAELKIGALMAMSKALGQPEGDAKGWRKLLFNLKNSMKHMDGPDDRYLDVNIETNARQKIGDTIGNLERLGVPRSQQVIRFNAFRLARKEGA